VPVQDEGPDAESRLPLEEARLRLKTPTDVFSALLVSGLLGHWTVNDGLEVKAIEHFERFGTQWRPELGTRGSDGDPFFEQLVPPGIKGGAQPTGTLTELQISPSPDRWAEKDTGWLAQFYVRPNPFFWPVPTSMALIGPPSLRLEAARSVPGSALPAWIFPDDKGAFAMLLVVGNPESTESAIRRAESVAFPILDELAMRFDQPLPIAQSFVVGIPSGVITVSYPKVPQPATVRIADPLFPKIAHEDLIDSVALYREAISSNNPFHQFLTLWKSYENACAVRGHWRRTHKKVTIAVTPEVFPEMYAFQGFEGLTFDQVKQKLNEPYRVALAHGQGRGGRPRTAANPGDLYAVASEVPVIRYMARVTIQNVAATLASTA